jgi:hypothetical protein
MTFAVAPASASGIQRFSGNKGEEGELIYD